MNLPENVRIKENSFAARIAAWKLGADSLALVLGNTIHLYNVPADRFLQNRGWVRHELKHIEQFRKHGTFLFLCKYVFEWMKNGYTHNCFEIEAREAEKNLPDNNITC